MSMHDKVKKMNDKNALNYIIAKVKKAIKSDDEKYIKDVKDLTTYKEDYICNQCIHEDFGYCGLRSDHTFSDIETYKKFCLPAFLKTHI